MARSLVLNITDAPLNVVSARRAALLVMDGKADTVCLGDNVLRSEKICLEVPSVIRLRYFVNIPYVRPRTISRKSVFARDGHRCQYCGKKAESIDHIIPKSKGGKHIWENVVAACKPCNSRKQDRLLSETSLDLIQHPRAPVHFTNLLLNGGKAPRHWAPYLVKV